MADTYAIIETGGKQYRAQKGASLLVDRLAAGEGDKITLKPLMFRGDGSVVLESSELEKVKVEARVAEHLRGEKIRVFRYKPKKGYRKRHGHRSELTRLEVLDVKLLSRKPAAAKADDDESAATTAKAETAAKSTAKAEATAKPATQAKAETATKPAAAKAKTAAKPAAAKPAATKKPAAKKPAAKPAPKKTEEDA